MIFTIAWDFALSRWGVLLLSAAFVLALWGLPSGRVDAQQSTPAPAAQPRVVAPPPDMRPMAGATLVIRSLGATAESGQEWPVVDAGTVSLLTQTELTERFEAVNSGAAPITVRSFRTSCKCTSVQWEVPSPGDGVTIAPGRVAAFHATVDLTRLSQGPLNKFVGLYGDMPGTSLALVEIRGSLDTGIRLSPPALDFGSIPRGQPKTLSAVLQVDPRIAGADAPVLVSSNHAIALSPLVPVASGNAAVTAYRVTAQVARDAPDGTLEGLIGIALQSPGNTRDLRAIAMRNFSVTTSGTVVGRLHASPDKLNFGGVQPGSLSTRVLEITADSMDLLSSVGCSSTAGWLVVALERNGTGGYRYRVTVGPDIPPGPQHAQLTFVGHSNEQLVVPVTATAIHAGATAH